VIILGIETATRQVGCAVGGQEGVLGSFHASHGRYHAEILTPAIEFTCKQARIEMSEISCVAVDLGPGLFTGLRVGIATAKAMAMALRVPMLGYSSLDLLAFPARWSNRLIVPVIDAKRGEVFWATYRHVAGGVQRLGDYRVGKAEELAAEIVASKEEALLIGDGALRYTDAFADLANVETATVGNAYPSAAALVELAQPRAIKEEFVQPSELAPLYLRKSDAEVNWDLREGLVDLDAPSGRA
jgi:tRNA threonylcarbamoyladenosine biosynthesis protein TsaB